MAENSGSPGSAANQAQDSQEQQYLSSFISEIVRSPLNLALVAVIAVLVYKIVKNKTRTEEPVPEVKKLPKLRRDFTIEELTTYDGKGPDGRILVAVNGNVYDVTRGSKFYGPGGPYEAFGGRDASRALARFAVDAATDKYDDLSDLNTAEMNSVNEWEEQFKERYDHVGKLLKPGEAPTNYSDEEDEGSQQETETKSENYEAEAKTDRSETEGKTKSD
ncbi:membrane-associated progesterone receptor component 1 [Harpegnathos saltator]|uniref:Membrane-associated progesterone receptor component 2 n=1 Tax=Harpegnathos saltator TaxID=610380 RepID=E2BWH9_HARSA|nr:membrane-associated progesterone receptor component 1 [Harpegnathos saltator]EFN79935.1 Membrane-associated progesterone receptor component 2 [Harpegnathos saltator]